MHQSLICKNCVRAKCELRLAIAADRRVVTAIIPLHLHTHTSP